MLWNVRRNHFLAFHLFPVIVHKVLVAGQLIKVLDSNLRLFFK